MQGVEFVFQGCSGAPHMRLHASHMGSGSLQTGLHALHMGSGDTQKDSGRLLMGSQTFLRLLKRR
jgi:hypothetical protein